MERKGLPATAGPLKSRRHTTKTHDSSSPGPPRKRKAAGAAFEISAYAWEGIRIRKTVRQRPDLGQCCCIAASMTIPLIGLPDRLIESIEKIRTIDFTD